MAKVIYCGWTGSCLAGASLAGIGGFTLTADTWLERTGYEPYFTPLAKDAINFIHENYGVFTKKMDSTPITNTLPNQGAEPDNNVEYEVLIKGVKGLDPSEAKDLTDLWGIYEKLDPQGKKEFWSKVYKNVAIK